MGSSPPCAPSLLSLGGCISHLWNQTRVRLCPHRAARTLVPVCNGIPPPHSGGSLFQAKHAPGRAGSPNTQLPNHCPAPGGENHCSGSSGRNDSVAGQLGPSHKPGSVPSPMAIFTSKARPSASSGVSCLLADAADGGTPSGHPEASVKGVRPAGCLGGRGRRGGRTPGLCPRRPGLHMQPWVGCLCLSAQQRSKLGNQSSRLPCDVGVPYCASLSKRVGRRALGLLGRSSGKDCALPMPGVGVSRFDSQSGN